MDYSKSEVIAHIEEAIENEHFIEAFLYLHMAIESSMIPIIWEKIIDDPSIHSLEIEDFDRIHPGKNKGLFSAAGLRFGVSICEDIWYSDGQSGQQAMGAGAEAVL